MSTTAICWLRRLLGKVQYYFSFAVLILPDTMNLKTISHLAITRS